MISEDKSSERTDVDILQCKADILRSRDTTPPYDKKGCQPPRSQHTDKNANRVDSPVVATVNHKPAVASQHSDSGIPKFDLAEDIMAEHRRITAIKRKAPGKRIEAVSKPLAAGPVGSAGLSQWPRPPAQEQIIAEIVARDIEKLCGGNIPVTGNRLNG